MAKTAQGKGKESSWAPAAATERSGPSAISSRTRGAAARDAKGRRTNSESGEVALWAAKAHSDVTAAPSEGCSHERRTYSLTPRGLHALPPWRGAPADSGAAVTDTAGDGALRFRSGKSLDAQSQTVAQAGHPLQQQADPGSSQPYEAACKARKRSKNRAARWQGREAFGQPTSRQLSLQLLREKQKGPLATSAIPVGAIAKMAADRSVAKDTVLDDQVAENRADMLAARAQQQHATPARKRNVKAVEGKRIEAAAQVDGGHGAIPASCQGCLNWHLLIQVPA
jgi:hypothetical protein